MRTYPCRQYLYTKQRQEEEEVVVYDFMSLSKNSVINIRKDKAISKVLSEENEA